MQEEKQTIDIVVRKFDDYYLLELTSERAFNWAKTCISNSAKWVGKAVYLDEIHYEAFEHSVFSYGLEIEVKDGQ